MFVGIEGTKQQINNIINKPFVVRFIIKSFDSEDSFEGVRVTSGIYNISLITDYTVLFVYFIIDPTALTVKYQTTDIFIAKIDNKIELHYDDNEVYSVEEVEYENPLDNSSVIITAITNNGGK